MDFYNQRHYQEVPGNVSLAGVYGRREAILARRREVERRTIEDS